MNRVGWLVGWAATLVACGAAPVSTPATVRSSADRDREQVAQLALLDDRVIERLAASDPRIAARFGVTPSKATLNRIGTEGVLAEDGNIAFRGSSLDLFSFRARARTLATTEKDLAAWKPPLPEAGPPDGALARPRLERELLARTIVEERARVDEESALDDASGSLVRGIVATWSSGATAWEWHDRDEWVARRLVEIGDSIKNGKARVAPSDLEPALFELEKLLVPMQFPRGVAALTSLHGAIDADERPALTAMPPELLAQRLRVHLGVTAPLAQIAAALEAARARVMAMIASDAHFSADPNVRAPIDKRARALVLGDVRCPKVATSPLRGAAPSVERATICGALQTVVSSASGTDRVAALLALHDMLVIATWTMAPPAPHARIATLSFRSDEDIADRMREIAAARPLEALSAALAIELVYASPAEASRRASAWIALGDVPLDIARRELVATSDDGEATSSPPPPASLRP